MHRIAFFAALVAAVISGSAAAQTLQGDLGDFSLKVGTTPSRSMAQGLVTPSTSANFQGGMDFSHPSGFYFGQWTANESTSDQTAFALDSYAGYKTLLTDHMGYEFGVIRYGHLNPDLLPSNEYYSGITFYGRRLGAAVSYEPGRRDTAIYADLGKMPLLDFGMSMRLGNHILDTPYEVSSGNLVRAFNDWSLNLSKQWRKTRVNLMYADSSLGESQCAAYSGINAYCGSTFLLKASHPLF